jgi:hypothetical protein
MSDEVVSSIPSLELLETRFSFVKNDLLKSNSAVYLQYTILLIALSEDSKLDGLKYSIYKDIIIHTASVIESILYYAITEYITKGKVDQSIFGYSYNYAEMGKINHDCIDFTDSDFIVVKRGRDFKNKSRDLGFDDINRAAKLAKIIDDALYSKAENLRKKRNLIHLSSLEKSSNDYLAKADVSSCLGGAKSILLAVEAKLNML